VQFRILGSLEVADGDGAISLDAPKQRALLGVFLLYPNEVVSTVRLIDELWGERPPATATKVLQTYVSQLRKILGDDVIATRLPGYFLRVEEGELDSVRFRRLVAEGHELAVTGDYERADALYRDALALWRGPPLAGVTFESFARSEVERLEEERLEALTDRIDCELALGLHHELVSELESIVKQHPLRERLRAQLMVALYRSGRQADALAAYHDGRRTLVEELGLEPGRELHDLEQAILRHDAALEAPVSHADVAGVGRRRGLLAAVSAVGVAAVLALALSSAFDGGSGGLSTIPTNAVGVIDPESNTLVAEVPVGVRPGPLSVGDGSVWVVNIDDDSVSRIDPDTREVGPTLAVGGYPSEVASDGRSAWVILAAESRLAKAEPEYRGALSSSQVHNRAAEAWAKKTHHDGRPLGALGCSLAGINIRIRAVVGRGELWYVCSSGLWTSTSGQLARLTLADGEMRVVDLDFGSESVPTAFSDIAYGLGSAWVVNWATGSVFEVDPATNKALLLGAIPVGKEPLAIAVGAGSLWVANYADDSVSRIEVTRPRGRAPFVTTIPVGDGPVDVAFGEDAAWVANSLDRTVSRIDPDTNDVVATISVGREPLHLAAGEGAVWVTAEPPVEGVG
jgi:YVTN family beta-propeller protein